MANNSRKNSRNNLPTDQSEAVLVGADVVSEIDEEMKELKNEIKELNDKVVQVQRASRFQTHPDESGAIKSLEEKLVTTIEIQNQQHEDFSHQINELQ